MRPEPKDRRSPDAGQDVYRAFNANVGDTIRRARQALGWTQAFLAEQAGISPNYVARLERGELGPSLFVARSICEALGISVDALVRDPEAPSSASANRVSGVKRRAGT